jgi:amino acid adenylation domain-containing protein
MKRFETLLREAAIRRPQHPAVICGEARLSYAELDAAAEQLAVGLVREADLADGERCVIFADNRIETCIAIFATLRAGGVFSVLNPSTKSTKLGFVLRDCEASVLFIQRSLLPVLRAVDGALPALRKVVVIDGLDAPLERALDWNCLLGEGAELPSPTPRGVDIDLAMLVYTSGSTGQPKGVMMTHQNVHFAADSICTYLEVGADDVVLSVLPLAFDYGLYQLLMAVRCGYTLVLERSFAFPMKVLPLLQREGVTGFPLVPTIAAMLVQMKNLPEAWARSVRFLTNTAAALPPAHISRLQELFPNARVFSMYGMTESKRCTWLPPAELSRRPDSVGIAIPGTQAWVADEDGRPLPPGTVGQLVVRGGHVMQGYWNNPGATARTLKAGRYPWERVLHTGDLFRADAEGFLYFVGRRDDILKTRGEKVAPKEVEAALYALDGIKEAAVIGVPDPVLGQAIRAVVVLAEDSDLGQREILAHCRARLEDFMVPRDIEFRAELPKTNTGKIQRARLQAEAEGSEFFSD